MLGLRLVLNRGRVSGGLKRKGAVVPTNGRVCSIEAACQAG